MFQDAFIKLDPPECAQLLDEINPVLQGSDFDPQTATILAQDMSFYPGYRFLDIADFEVNPPRRKYVIYKPGTTHVLDWTNAPIYKLNDIVPLGLSSETVADYVRFFFTYVHGPHGKFTIAETVDDIEWREEPPPAARKALGGMLKPVEIANRHDDGSFSGSVCLMFKNSLYRTAITVSKTGRITMADEEILVDDMPVLDATFGQ